MSTLYLPDFTTPKQLTYDKEISQLLNGHTDGETYLMNLQGNNLIKIKFITTNVSFVIFNLYDSNQKLLFNSQSNIINSVIDLNIPQSGDYYLVIGGGSNSSNNLIKFKVTTKSLLVDIKFKAKETIGIINKAIPTQIIKENGCNLPIVFEHLSGELPKGLKFNDNGFITGMIQELDCYDTKSTIGSINNYSSDDNTSKSIPFFFEFGAWIKGNKEFTYKKSKASICVYNNWSYDTNDFLNKVKFGEYEKENSKNDLPDIKQEGRKIAINCSPSEITELYTKEKILEIKKCYPNVNILNEIKIKCNSNIKKIDSKIKLKCNCNEIIENGLEMIKINCKCEEIAVIKEVNKKDFSTYAIQNVDEVNEELSIKKCRTITR